MNKSPHTFSNDLIFSTPYRIVISDLDGTLFNSSHTVSEFTRETIYHLTQQGIIFSIATGRHFLDAKNTLKHLGVQSILISSNGAMINDFDDKLLFQSIIEPKWVEAIATSPMPPEAIINMYTPDVWFVAKESEHLMSARAKAFHPNGFDYQVIPLSQFHLFPCVKIYVTIPPPGNIQALEEVEKRINTLYGKNLHITFSTKFTFEIMSNDVNKGRAVDALLAYEKLTRDDAIAFGDGMNDVEMLRTVGKALIMKNADERLKIALPNLEIIEETNDQDAVARYLAKYLLH